MGMLRLDSEMLPKLSWLAFVAASVIWIIRWHAKRMRSRWKGEKILIVDDDALTRDMVRASLRHEGFQVREAEDGREALRLLRQEHIHLVILNRAMANPDGIQARLKRGTRIPIILLSAKGEGDSAAGRTAGAAEGAAKPFNPAALVARVKAQLRR
ncbi:response regulator transcription factor [Cohnella nanjingensis]|uniref:Response regulator n=1 Tax=Cohnella nanjingensis TaxID=1387779 RepID=A0A7X0RKI5_9BACL|nr:response regulator [Cohnella nanjingensis]MBB6669125.1 response regulator [Cohnella nanjingensis]